MTHYETWILATTRNQERLQAADLERLARVSRPVGAPATRGWWRVTARLVTVRLGTLHRPVRAIEPT